jgi:hypothetical protein
MRTGSQRSNRARACLQTGHNGARPCFHLPLVLVPAFPGAAFPTRIRASAGRGQSPRPSESPPRARGQPDGERAGGVERAQGVELTESGQQVALEVIRHHRLLELYLVDVLGFPWDEAHAEAECLEHYVSEKMEARIAAALGDPTRDPHGDPIPSQDGAVAERRDKRLLDLEPGEGGIIVRVSDRDLEQLRYLGGLGLYPSVTVVVLEKVPFEGGSGLEWATPRTFSVCRSPPYAKKGHG